MSGNGTQVLAGSSSYTGGTTVSFGTLQVGAANALPTSTALILSNSAGAVLNLNGNSQTVGSLAGGGGSGGNVALGGGTLTVGNAASTTYSGVIGGNGALTKQGTGMLTLNTVQGYAGPTIVSGGTLQLGVAASAPGLAHRWSFNNSLADSVGGSTATLFGSASLATSANQVTLPGGNNGTSYVSLGSNLLPTTNSPATIELWATSNQVQTWARIFDFGSSTTNYLAGMWTQGTTSPGGYGYNNISNTSVGTFTLGTQYQIALVLAPSGANTQLTFYQLDASGNVIASASTTPSWNLSQLSQVNEWLGHSEFAADHDASASYNEVRIWDTALTQAQLSAFSVLGPDSLSNGNLLPTATPLTIAANATLDLGGARQQVASLSDYTPGSGGSLVNSNTGIAAVMTLSPTGGSTTFSGQIQGGGAWAR